MGSGDLGNNISGDTASPVKNNLQNWIGFETERSLGLGLPGLTEEDSIWRLGNEPQLYILRQKGINYVFVGPCYVFEAVDKSYVVGKKEDENGRRLLFGDLLNILYFAFFLALHILFEFVWHSLHSPGSLLMVVLVLL